MYAASGSSVKMIGNQQIRRLGNCGARLVLQILFLLAVRHRVGQTYRLSERESQSRIWNATNEREFVGWKYLIHVYSTCNKQSRHCPGAGCVGSHQQYVIFVRHTHTPTRCQRGKGKRPKFCNSVNRLELLLLCVCVRTDWFLAASGLKNLAPQPKKEKKKLKKKKGTERERGRVVVVVVSLWLLLLWCARKDE